MGVMFQNVSIGKTYFKKESIRKKVNTLYELDFI